jgi:hypothetical protein
MGDKIHIRHDDKTKMMVIQMKVPLFNRLLTEYERVVSELKRGKATVVRQVLKGVKTIYEIDLREKEKHVKEDRGKRLPHPARGKGKPGVLPRRTRTVDEGARRPSRSR